CARNEIRIVQAPLTYLKKRVRWKKWLLLRVSGLKRIWIAGKPRESPYQTQPFVDCRIGGTDRVPSRIISREKKMLLGVQSSAIRIFLDQPGRRRRVRRLVRLCR